MHQIKEQPRAARPQLAQLIPAEQVHAIGEQRTHRLFAARQRHLPPVRDQQPPGPADHAISNSQRQQAADDHGRGQGATQGRRRQLVAEARYCRGLFSK